MWDKVITRKRRRPKSDGVHSYREPEAIAENEALYQVWVWLNGLQDQPKPLWAVTAQREAKRSWIEILAAIRAGQLR